MTSLRALLGSCPAVLGKLITTHGAQEEQMADLCSQVEVLWKATTGVTSCVKLLTLVRELH